MSPFASVKALFEKGPTAFMVTEFLPEKDMGFSSVPGIQTMANWPGLA
jgi:hypothetical protein